MDNPNEPGETVPKNEDDETLIRGLNRLNINSVIKPKSFKKGENFNAFCDRFLQYVEVTKLTDQALYIHFLSLLDDRTYQLLADVKLESPERGDAERFCRKYMQVYYPESAIQSLQNEVLACQQQAGESIDDYSYNLRAKGKVAFPDEHMREVNCRIAFLNGVRNVNMKRKLNESNHLNFEEAIEMAKRLERVENMMSNSMVEVTPILNSLDETEVKPEGKEHDSRSKWHRNEEPYKKDRYNDRKSRSRSRVRFDDLRSQSSGSHNSRSMSPGNGRSRSWSRERNNYSNRGYSSQNRRGGYNNQRSYNNKRQNVSTRFSGNCYTCNRNGHRSRDCWFNPENTSRFQNNGNTRFQNNGNTRFQNNGNTRFQNNGNTRFRGNRRSRGTFNNQLN